VDIRESLAAPSPRPSSAIAVADEEAALERGD